MTTITLTKPITHNSTTITELTFREATTGDFAAADAVTGEFTKTLAILAGMSGQTLPMMKAIPMKEFTRIVGEVAALMGESKESLADSST